MMYQLACCLVIIRISCKWGWLPESAVVFLLHACWFDCGPPRPSRQCQLVNQHTAALAPLLPLTPAAPCIFLLACVVFLGACLRICVHKLMMCFA